MSEPRFSSITHLHIFAVINTLIKYRFDTNKKKVFRILDIGCGNGKLIKILVNELKTAYSGLTFELYGLDVNDSHVQQKGFFEITIHGLQDQFPTEPWNERVKLIGSNQVWPFDNNHFDFIYSNQVMEHVFKQPFFLNEVRRTMTEDGWSVHLYPLRHYIYEGHIRIPYVHKFRSWTMTYHWIKWASYIGLGTYKEHKIKGLDKNIHSYAKRHADYLAFQVNYQTLAQITNTCKECQLKPSFDFTYLYYKQKVRSLFKLKPLELYNIHDISSAKNSFYFFFLKYISGITLILRKKDYY